MELKAFIESGIIESYLLGTASIEDIRLVNDMIAQHPELKKEFVTIEEGLLKAAESNALPPDPKIKENIFKQINTQQKPEGKVVPFEQKKPSNILKYGMVAAIAALVISTVVNIVMISQNVGMQNEMAKLSKEKTYMQTEVDNQQKNLDKMEQQFAVLTDPNNQSVTLKGLDLSPNSMATVFWNNANKDVYLYVNNLPAPPTDKQYQLWAIVDGKPVDAGIFNVGEGETLQKMKSFTNAQAFAVTLEKKGGSPAPTMEAMYVMGTV
jgi:anti-sigma-K factor RskA